MSENQINAVSLPNLADMSDAEIDIFASQIWESIPQPYQPNEEIGN